MNLYDHTGVTDMSPAVATARPLIYVPSNNDGTVSIIDPISMKVTRRYAVGKLVQHVVPDWDLSRLYATASDSNLLVPIDPASGDRGQPIPVDAPYNLYFSPDGKYGIVMAERLNRIDYYDRLTWTLKFSVDTGAECDGVNHADWSPDGSWFLATCEFSGQLLKVDTASGAILNRLTLSPGSKPQDLRIVPDGSKFYVADMERGGIWVIGGDGTTVTRFVRTGVGAHGIYPSRDAARMYITNRGRKGADIIRLSREGEGSVSVIDPATDSIETTWSIPGGGSPDMGGVSADGSTFWVSGRYDAEVYAFDTVTGELRAKIPVSPGPHGLCVFPQPGRYSLGHTGNYR